MLRIFTLLLATLAAFSATAQDHYPSRPITMIVPFPPGGVADLTGRPTAQAMEKLLKQPMAIVNKAGAGGAIGMATVANAKPDGYTLLMALSSISIIPEADKLFGREPAYHMNQLAPIALISADPTVLVVRSQSPYKTLKELVDDARKRPNGLSFSSSGVYGTLHMAIEMFTHAAGLKMRHVPYTGAGPALTSLLGGHVDLLASGPSVVTPQIKAGTLRPLAVWGAKRLAALPDVPTFKELGYDIEFYIWSGIFVPAGTPAAIVNTLRDAAKKAVADPEFKASMEKIETPVAYLDAPEFQKFWDKDAKRMADAVKNVGKIEDKK